MSTQPSDTPETDAVEIGGSLYAKTSSMLRDMTEHARRLERQRGMLCWLLRGMLRVRTSTP